MQCDLVQYIRARSYISTMCGSLWSIRFKNLIRNTYLKSLSPNFKEPQGSIPWNRFLVRNPFHCEFCSWRHGFYVKELNISELSLYSVMMKSRFMPLNNNISWDTADSIPYLVPTQFQESIFPHNSSKIPSLVLEIACVYRNIFFMHFKCFK
jgi:hypothetical protein